MTAHPNELLTGARPEPKRDRWGRYLIPHPDGSGEVAWTRATTMASAVAETFNLAKWQTRMAAVGLAKRADLLARVAAVADPNSDDGKRELNKLVEQAQEIAGASQGANSGTALHAFTEAHDAGRDTVVIPAPYDADVAAYTAKMRAAHAKIHPRHIERIVIVPELGVAGTFDRIASIEHPPYNPVSRAPMIGDLKTGKDLAYSWTEIAIQLALYAHASHIFDTATGQLEPMPEVDQEQALVMHLPVGRARCDLYLVNIVDGWKMAQVCHEVREWRKRKDLAQHLPINTTARQQDADEGDASAARASSVKGDAGSTVEAEGTDTPGAPRQTAEPATPSERSQWITDRVLALKPHPDALRLLAQEWPFPGNTRGPWTDEQVDQLDAYLRAAETAAQVPFPEPDPADPGPQPLPPPPEPASTAPPAPAGPEGVSQPTAVDGLRAAISAMDENARFRLQIWVNEGARADRVWGKPASLTDRSLAITYAAIDCLCRFEADTLDETEQLTRAAYQLATGKAPEPQWQTGALLGSLTRDEAQLVSKFALRFVDGDADVCARLGQMVAASPQ